MHDDLHRRRGLGGAREDRARRQGRDLRRLVRRLRDARRASRSRRTTFACGVDIVGPSNLVDAARLDPAVLEVVLRGHGAAHRRSAHGRGQGKLLEERSPLTSRGAHQAAAAHRAGRERPAREAGGVRPDRRRDEGERPAGDLRAVSGRRPRLRAAAEPPVVLRDRRRLPGPHLGGRYEPIGEGLRRLQRHRCRRAPTSGAGPRARRWREAANCSGRAARGRLTGLRSRGPHATRTRHNRLPPLLGLPLRDGAVPAHVARGDGRAGLGQLRRHHRDRRCLRRSPELRHGHHRPRARSAGLSRRHHRAAGLAQRRAVQGARPAEPVLRHHRRQHGFDGQPLHGGPPHPQRRRVHARRRRAASGPIAP